MVVLLLLYCTTAAAWQSHARVIGISRRPQLLHVALCQTPPPPPAPPAMQPSSQLLTRMLCGVGIYGGGAFVWQSPVLLDGYIESTFHIAHADVVSSTSAIFLAWAIGATVLGSLADNIGRKPVAVGSALVIALHLFGISAATDATGLLAARIAGGFACGGVASGVTLALEAAPEEDQTNAMFQLNSFHFLAVVLILGVHVECETANIGLQQELCGLGLLVGAMGAATALLIPESSAYRAKGASLSDASAEEVEEDQLANEITEPPSLLSAEYAQPQLALVACFIAISAVYFSLTFSAGSLSSDLALNIFLLALLDLPGKAVCLLSHSHGALSGITLPACLHAPDCPMLSLAGLWCVGPRLQAR